MANHSSTFHNGKMWQNLVWATGYNVIAIPFAGALALAGVVFSPAAGS